MLQKMKCWPCYPHLARYRCSSALFVSLGSAEHQRAVVSYWHWKKEKVHVIAEILSEEIVRVLAFHTLTSCDSTSAPFGCGKRAAFCTLKGNIERFKELSNLGASAESSNTHGHCYRGHLFTLRPKEQNKRHQWFKVQIKCEKGIGELEAAANQRQRDSPCLQGKL